MIVYLFNNIQINILLYIPVINYEYAIFSVMYSVKLHSLFFQEYGLR